MTADPLSMEAMEAARGKLEGWLKATTPQSVAAYADRLLVRSRMANSAEGGADLDVLLSGVPWVLNAIALHAAEPRNDPIAPCVISVCLRDLGYEDEADQVAELTAPLVGWARETYDVAPEPVRGAFYHWAVAAGLATPPDTEGALPTAAVGRVWYHLHALLTASDHGRQLVAVSGASGLRPHLSYFDTMVQHTDLAGSTELIAQALFVECHVRPRREAVLQELLLALLSAIDAASPLAVGVPASLDVVHRTATVASIALYRVLSTT